jgi:NitT/TauT family transport system substrate-binding protein
MLIDQDRRAFLAGLSAAGAAGLLDLRPVHAESDALETTRVRLDKFDGICVAPQYIAKELLHAEGFTDVEYRLAPKTVSFSELITERGHHFALSFLPEILPAMESGVPIRLLAGVHTGCFELFAANDIRSVTELKGKTVGVPAIGVSEHMFISVIAAYVGLDPATDINWVVDPTLEAKEAFISGKIDAFLGFPPQPQELRERGVGHVLVNSAVDKPWSDYFCCLLVGQADFVKDYPNATKRVVRSMLKAADLCSSEPEWAARQLVDEGFTARYDYAVQVMRELEYGVWRDFDPEDTTRFYALRLHELGMIKSTPDEIISEFADWRFLNELKRELKM